MAAPMIAALIRERLRNVVIVRMGFATIFPICGHLCHLRLVFVFGCGFAALGDPTVKTQTGHRASPLAAALRWAGPSGLRSHFPVLYYVYHCPV